MNRKTKKTLYLTYLLVAVFITVLAVQVDAAVTGPTDVTIKKACISMPDGGVTAPVTPPTPPACPSGTIQMWLPHDGTKYLTPGSFKITAAENDSLTITVRNELGIPVSLVIPGQVMTPNNGPVWFADIANPYTSAPAELAFGSRPTPSNPTDPNDPAFKYRVRSFAHETVPGAAGTPGAAQTYTWPILKEGTYLILSGTHPSLQVPMGIYGILVVQAAGGGPYDGVAVPNSDITLLFSEIDPEIHNTADDVTQSFPSTNDYKPKYFLINGKPFPATESPLPIGTVGQTTLIRFLNAGIDTYVPLLQGLSMQVIAEDGFLKPANLRFSRYSVDLHAGKTFDALLTNPAAGYIPVYDRRLYLSSATQAPGGMLTYLEVTGPVTQTLTVNKTGAGTGSIAVESIPGGIYCREGANATPPDPGCTRNYQQDTEIKLVAHVEPGSILSGWTVNGDTTSCAGTGDCIVTMDAAKTVTANFGTVSNVRFITPAKNDTIPASSRYTITWAAPANMTKFRLRYSLNNGATWLLIGKNISGYSFTWNVPTTRLNRQILIELTGFNAAGVAIGSRNINVFIEVVKLTSPNGGETLVSGNFFDITWTTNAPSGFVKKVVLEYRKNSGAPWIRITTPDLTQDLGIYHWEVPTVTNPKPNSKVRVTLKDAAGNLIGRDVSDAVFTIRRP